MIIDKDDTCSLENGAHKNEASMLDLLVESSHQSFSMTFYDVG
jgi:hypothetical protein